MRTSGAQECYKRSLMSASGGISATRITTETKSSLHSEGFRQEQAHEWTKGIHVTFWQRIGQYVVGVLELCGKLGLKLTVG